MKTEDVDIPEYKQAINFMKKHPEEVFKPTALAAELEVNRRSIAYAYNHSDVVDKVTVAQNKVFYGIEPAVKLIKDKLEELDIESE